MLLRTIAKLILNCAVISALGSLAVGAMASGAVPTKDAAVAVSSALAAPALSEAGVTREDLQAGFSVLLRSKADAQEALDRRYRIEE